MSTGKTLHNFFIDWGEEIAWFCHLCEMGLKGLQIIHSDSIIATRFRNK